jgi:phospholipid transport system substrate-binding protein
MVMRGFSPGVRQALRSDIPAALLLALFTGLTAPFAGLILRRELGATAFQLSLMSAATGASLLLSLVWVRALRGRAPLASLVWPSFVARGVFLLVPLVAGAWSFVGLSVLASVFGAAAGPAHAAVVEGVYPRAERGRALGVVKMAGAALGIGVALGAGQLFERVDWRWIFPAAAVLGMAASLTQRRLRLSHGPASEAAAAPGLAGAWAAVRDDRAFRRLLVAAFLFGAGCWIQTPAHPLLLVDVLGVSAAQVGVFAAAAALATLVGSPGWGWLVDRRSSLAALALMYAIGAAAPLICFAAWSPWALVGSAVADALAGVGLDLVWLLVVIDVAGPQRARQYVAIGATLAGVRGILGPLAGGLLIHAAGVRAVYLVAAALEVAAAWLVARELRRPAGAKEAVASGGGGYTPGHMTNAPRLLALVLSLAWAPAALAGQSPTEQLREYTDQVVKMLGDATLRPQDRRAAVRKIAHEVFDVGETAKRALARHWQSRSAAERDEFIQLFAELLERSYISRIDEYGGEKVRYVSETVDGDRAVVRARVVTKKGTEVPVESRLIQRGERWLIYDILIENVSLIANYRAQFDKIIRTTSFDELVRRLKTRRDEFDSDFVSKPGS